MHKKGSDTHLKCVFFAYFKEDLVRSMETLVNHICPGKV